MTYWALNAVFLAVVVLVASAALLARRSPQWRSVGLAALAVLALTAVFDNVMIAVDLFGYNDDRISGAFLGLAPLEDFAYAIAAVVLLPSLWDLFDRRGTHMNAEPVAAPEPAASDTERGRA
ncbi:lycopene cyclase domain-containing protein [Salinibacterium sp. dk2585]|uniref:lycopene cyclase domain-containing protein n=1 Tax=unclassified Salinibacterium TaxID=2632331 RepID=UPI0011C2489B|nr:MULTISPECIES: lycopene cyclase domain-containing protein [unclassified Salinibacterium]QEE60273.1 lycopene cyclase domain-containing protein [Salinibacterium sp. dk2585]TXK55345.1 lycopene cyclase domain-containing protein [Salinibacterium sp. dk5596]